jgi:hypothetical protein
MKRSVKRATVIGIAAILMALGVITAAPAAANEPCSNGQDAFCAQEARGWAPGTISQERGAAATNIQSDSFGRNLFDSDVFSFDRPKR